MNGEIGHNEKYTTEVLRTADFNSLIEALEAKAKNNEPCPPDLITRIRNLLTSLNSSSAPETPTAPELEVADANLETLISLANQVLNSNEGVRHLPYFTAIIVDFEQENINALRTGRDNAAQFADSDNGSFARVQIKNENYLIPFKKHHIIMGGNRFFMNSVFDFTTDGIYEDRKNYTEATIIEPAIIEPSGPKDFKVQKKGIIKLS